MSGLNNHQHHLNLLSMMILIIGFTCPPSIHFKFITKCDRYSITKCDRTMHHLIKEIKIEQDINSALQHLKRKKVSQEQRLIHDFFSISSVIVKQFRELFVTRENSQYFYMKAFCKGM